MINRSICSGFLLKLYSRLNSRSALFKRSSSSAAAQNAGCHCIFASGCFSFGLTIKSPPILSICISQIGAFIWCILVAAPLYHLYVYKRSPLSFIVALELMFCKTKYILYEHILYNDHLGCRRIRSNVVNNIMQNNIVI